MGPQARIGFSFAPAARAQQSKILETGELNDVVIDNFLPFCALRLPGRWLPYMQYGFTGQCDHIR